MSSGKGGWDSGEIETVCDMCVTMHNEVGGKGGWDSGEIETTKYSSTGFSIPQVERVDGTQARLKPANQRGRTQEYLAWKGRMGLRRD